MAGKILYLSLAVPPDTSGSAIIAPNLARQFTRDEMVVVGEKPYDKPPITWYPEWPELLYVQTIWPFTWRLTRSWRKVQFPWVLLRCLWIVWTRGVDRILAVFPDEQFLLVGYLLALLTRRPMYVYFHNTYYENRVGWRRAVAGWFQPRVFHLAKHVFVMSRGMSDYYRNQYPRLRQTPLVHAFSEATPPCDALPPVGSPLRLAFCGNVNHSCEDAASRLGQAIARCKDVVVHIYSGLAPGVFRRIGLLRPGDSCETLPRDEIPGRLAQADAVLLPHGFSDPCCAAEEFVTIFPTKTIEYLISGRPILAHSPPESYLTRFLVENDCALVVDRPDVNSLCAAIERLRTDGELRLRLVRNALRAAEFFRGPRVATELRQRLGISSLPSPAESCPCSKPRCSA